MSTLTVFAKTTGVNDSTVGTVNWTNIPNVAADDNATADASSSPVAISKYLRVSPQSLASISSGSTINQIQILLGRWKTGANILSDNSVRIYKSGIGFVGSDLALGGTWPGTETTVIYTWDSSNWGSGWTRDEIVNDLQFAIAVNLNNHVAHVDWVQFTIDFVSVTLVLPLITETITFYDATLLNNTLIPPLFDVTPILFNLTMVFRQTIDVPLIDNSVLVYAPALAMTIRLPFISVNPVLYAPALEFAQTLHIPFIASSTSLYAGDMMNLWSNTDSLTPELWTDVDIPQ